MLAGNVDTADSYPDDDPDATLNLNTDNAVVDNAFCIRVMSSCCTCIMTKNNLIHLDNLHTCKTQIYDNKCLTSNNQMFKIL